ncbi:ADP-ribosylglycohydrolase family protein [Nocardioides panaciterrulae]|uniref:ADP-ribosylglycohydrolase n=1 Tax=Nocardioides panaciterrulae TaxID=661492 RepID=A0A7Y9E8S5_9ACTN|nr:ADP-ribosylglycohydrolase family protein [Nocardioides panaciterrulae]NYD43214.1 ADP-ribosylglycohydrolase [Nocardioides panaciterrulae]
MSRLTWVQPPDLLAHELVASAEDGKDVAEVRARWLAAGGQATAPVTGLAQEGDESLRALARQLLDELEGLPGDPGLAGREPDGLEEILGAGSGQGPRQSSGQGSGQESEGAAVLADRALADRMLGAWQGRAAGCLLGKPVEKIPRHGIREILRSQGRWPLDDWFTAVGLPAEVAARWPWNRRSAPTSLAENIAGMPEDDDLNFPMLALDLVERLGTGFTTDDVADAWLANLPGGRVFTAERVAYRNLLLGDRAPRTATRHNPFREWIGAQIRADVYGWVNPGDPVAAARLAWTDAGLSHVRNGVYGAMFAAAACAEALVADHVDEVLAAGLAVVPPQSRYAAAISFGVDLGRSGLSTEQALDRLSEAYGHLHWVHVLNNAALVAYALTVSGGEFTTAITTVVTGGWDTDSNGATVGSVCGALAGAAALPTRWIAPLRNRVATSLPGFDGIGLDTLAERTLALVPEQEPAR